MITIDPCLVGRIADNIVHHAQLKNEADDRHDEEQYQYHQGFEHGLKAALKWLDELSDLGKANQ